MDSHYVQLSQVILMDDAQGSGKMTLLTQQGKTLILTSSAGYKKIIDKPTHVINNSMSCIDLIFCTNQNVSSNYEFLRSVIAISFMVKLTFMSPSHLYMSVKSRIIIR